MNIFTFSLKLVKQFDALHMVQSQDFKVHHSAESLGYSIWADIHVHTKKLNFV